MKTICLTLGLLLLTVLHTYAVPLGLEPSPTSCCFRFSNVKVPSNKIISIKKTHRSCLLPAFVVTTIKQKVICYRPSESWVQKAFLTASNLATVTRSNIIEGSSHT
ncbi:hypothetical protein DPEC_G00215710 [Dallia pectoralis]|uniref:Uncharacterized protein n=1 Tax=Dallia pectoralis TaxID=75939 RepID=A0ACC2G2D7_DALPE|nr:hypothetical protein DPEC_G00215710 [Dallia pectoralis]